MQTHDAIDRLIGKVQNRWFFSISKHYWLILPLSLNEMKYCLETTGIRTHNLRSQAHKL